MNDATLEETAERLGLSAEQLEAVSDASHFSPRHVRFESGAPVWEAPIRHHIRCGVLCARCEENVGRLRRGEPMLYERRLTTAYDDHAMVRKLRQTDGSWIAQNANHDEPETCANKKESQ